MAYSALDTRWWNLAGAATLAAGTACGPSIELDDDDGVADTDTGGDVDPDDEVGTDDDPPPSACMTAAECGPGFDCIDGQCIEYGDDDYCQDGDCYCGDYGDGYGDGYGCCYDGCCYDGCYEYDCYGHSDCEPGNLCGNEGDEYGQYCAFIDALPECADGAPALAPLPLLQEDDDEVISLSFVDANGDAAQDLVIGRTGEATLLLGPGQTPPVALDIPAGSAVRDIVSGDFNGDAIPDLAAALLPSGVAMFLGDGTGGFSLAPAGVVPLPGVESLAAVNFDDDERLDLAVSGEVLVAVMRGNGAGGFSETRVLANEAGGTVIASVPDEQSASVLAPIADRVLEWHGGSDADGEPDATRFGGIQIEDWQILGSGAAANRTLLGVGLVDQWTLLDVYRDDVEARYRLPDNRRIRRGDSGDLDGDGIADFVLGADTALTFVRVAPSGSLCATDLPFAEADTVDVLAVGDLNGDGRADVAIADGGVVTVMQSQ